MRHTIKRTFRSLAIAALIGIGATGCGHSTSQAIRTGAATSSAGSTSQPPASSTDTSSSNGATSTTAAANTTTTAGPTTTTGPTTTWINGGPGCNAVDTLQAISGDVNTLGKTSGDIDTAKATLAADTQQLNQIAAQAPQAAQTNAFTVAAAFQAAQTNYATINPNGTDSSGNTTKADTQALTTALNSPAAQDLRAWYAAHC